MNIRQTVEDKDFLKKDQFEKRDILRTNILTDNNCKIDSFALRRNHLLKIKINFFIKGV
jgi:hypothetical protein